MKKAIIFLMLILGLNQVNAQDQEMQELILDMQKLTQLKQILSDMKTGYEVVMKGYTTVRDISQGNFSLHKTFLDALMAVSPTVRNYKKVADIVSFQLNIVKEYKQAFNRFKQGGYFNESEINYMGTVYDNLFDQSLKNVDDLITVMTAGTLRMSDQERLSAIDKLYEDTQDKLVFLRHFNNNTSLLALQRAKDTNEVNELKKINGIK